jgi:hypothetical protein
MLTTKPLIKLNKGKNGVLLTFAMPFMESVVHSPYYEEILGSIQYEKYVKK